METVARIRVPSTDTLHDLAAGVDVTHELKGYARELTTAERLTAKPQAARPGDRSASQRPAPVRQRVR